jgi:rare lipoprotein A
VNNWKRGQHGFATYYARKFDGRRTASGSAFDNDALVAAHPRHPFGTTVRVTNLANGRSVDVRIVDRGPSRGARANGVIIDLSRAAAEALGFIRSGRTRVRLEVLKAEGAGAEEAESAETVSRRGRRGQETRRVS